MIEQLETLSKDEQELLLQAPALVSVLASCATNAVNPTQRKDAIKLAHLRTFTAPPLLMPYYKEVEKRFEADFNMAASRYAPFDAAKRGALQEETERVRQVLAKLPSAYSQVLHKSLEGYAAHVKQSTHTVFQDFIFPMAYARL